jgi:thymidylate synthase ThyX
MVGKNVRKNNMYKCEIIADSLSPQNHRLTTFMVTYPRIIHAEMCRHRMFSRNTASSRAIPFAKMVKDVINNPFIPIAWQKDHKGMQGNEYFVEPYNTTLLTNDWLRARDNAVDRARMLNDQGLTKQLCNRLLEPFVWTTELITTSEEGLQNFFELRCPKYLQGFDFYNSKKDTIKASEDGRHNDGRLLSEFTDIEWLKINASQAEIHIQKIAEMMWDAYNDNVPKQLEAGQWHLPMGNDIDYYELGSISSSHYKNNPNEVVDVNKWALKVSTARCARLSYYTLGDDPKVDYEADIKLHDRLLESKHMSPMEHCARAMSDKEYYLFVKGEYPTIEEDNGDIVNRELYPQSYSEGKYPNLYGWCSNFRGFISFRYMLENK